MDNRRLRIGMLGPLEVLADGRPVEIGGVRLRVLLTLLALDPGAAVPAERIIDALWEDDVPRGAANALQSLVSRLRALIGRDAVESRPGAYRLVVARGDVDVHDFEARLPAARRAATPAERSAGFGAALALWRGPALADAAGLRFTDAPAARLDALRRAALEERIDADLALGRHAALIPELRALAAADPLREPVTALLMRALYAAGHQAAALAAYEDAGRALGEALGVDPSPDLEVVYLAVLRQDPSLRPGSTPPEPLETPPPDALPSHAPKGNLRARLTSFIGRDADLRRVDDLLSRARLVTLTGPGGSGKTRLSLESGERVAGRMPDGAWLVEFAPVTDPAEVPAAALAALGALGRGGMALVSAGPGRMAAPDPADPLDRLVSALADRRLLLVLDNCEHLLDAAARLADQVLAACPGVRILATSREPLGITGETLWPVEPLELPPPPEDAPEDAASDAAVDVAAVSAGPAVRLFADRAAAVSPGFAVTGANAGWVVRICRALDGMPLAIELAAARLSAMTPAQVAARLDDRFRLLSAGSRTALPRHRTLRAVVEWSWDLLAEPERALWRRLAVFPGGASLESAEEVCAGPGLDRADVLDVLSALVDKSLVIVSGADGEPRYRMLETIRAYGLERLALAGEQERTRRAHADHFLRLAEEAEPHLYRAEQVHWLRRLAAEHDNCAAALRWAVSVRDAPLALRFCAALGWSWFLRGRLTEGAEHLEEILALPGVPADQPTAMALALAALTSLDRRAAERTDKRTAVDRLRRAQEICDGIGDEDLHPVLWLMLFIGRMQMDGRPQDPADGIERLLNARDPWARGLANFVHGQVSHNFGRTHLLEDAFDRALAGFREAGDRWGLSFTLTAQGEILGRRGEHRAAVALYEESLRLSTGLGRETSSLLYVTMRLGNELDLAGEHARARTIMLRLLEEDGTSRPEERVALHYQLGEIARRAGDTGEALARLARAEEMSAGLPGPSQFRAMVLSSRAQLDIALGAVEEGRARLDEALRDAVQAQDYPVLSYVLGGHAALCRALGDAERGAVLLGAADGLRGTRDLSQPDVIAVEDAVREALGEPAFAAAHERGRSWTFADLVEEFGLPHP